MSRRKTAQELELAGTRRPDRHGKVEDDVDFKKGTPFMPKGMSANAEKAWRRAVAELKKVGQLRPAYEAALAGYAVAYGKLLDDPSSMKASDHAQIRAWVSEFGLPPVSRMKLAADGGPPEAPRGDSSDSFDDV